MAGVKIVKLAEEYKHVKQLPKPIAGPAPRISKPPAQRPGLKKRVMVRRAKRKGARTAAKTLRQTERAGRAAQMEAAGPIKRQAIRVGRAIGVTGRGVGVAARVVGFGLKAAGVTGLAAGTFESGYKVGTAMREGVKAVQAHGHLQRTRKHAKKYGVTTTQKTLLGSKLLYGLATGDPGLKVKYKQRKRR